jgi:hypothetical protein
MADIKKMFGGMDDGPPFGEIWDTPNIISEKSLL